MVSTGPARRRSPEDVVDQLRELLTTSAVGNAQLMARFNDFLRDVTREVGRGERPDAAELFSRWLDFNLASYSILSKQSLALMDGLLSAARTTLIPSSAAGASAPTSAPTEEPRVELRLSGRQGERVATGFVIENHFDNPLDVSFECDDLTPASGKSLPATLVVFEPSRLAIPSRGQAVGQVAIALTTEFVVGETYSSTIRLLGFQGKEIGLYVTVLPPAEETGPANEPAAQPQTRRRGRSSP